MAQNIQQINSPELSQFSHILSHASPALYSSVDRHQLTAPESPKVVDGGIQEHTAQCINNLGKVLQAAGSSWEKVVKVNVYLDDMKNFKAMNEVYEKESRSGFADILRIDAALQLLPSPKPARTCIQAAHLPNSVDVEIEAIATY
ncbi:Endoribonuclease L-PSP [Mycena amicta]|nr:Endoribonuclease L-PSP [Mycena amicta]